MVFSQSDHKFQKINDSYRKAVQQQGKQNISLSIGDAYDRTEFGLDNKTFLN